MSMTVRELIEHLARFDDDSEVKLRDQTDPVRVFTIEAHAEEQSSVYDHDTDKESDVVIIG